jgi:hypothetical protein
MRQRLYDTYTGEEFKSLKGKMDAFNPNATTVEEFLGGTASFRTDLYGTGGTLLSHLEWAEQFPSSDDWPRRPALHQ